MDSVTPPCGKRCGELGGAGAYGHARSPAFGPLQLLPDTSIELCSHCPISIPGTWAVVLADSQHYPASLRFWVRSGAPVHSPPLLGPALDGTIKSYREVALTYEASVFGRMRLGTRRIGVLPERGQGAPLRTKASIGGTIARACCEMMCQHAHRYWAAPYSGRFTIRA